MEGHGRSRKALKYRVGPNKVMEGHGRSWKVMRPRSWGQIRTWNVMRPNKVVEGHGMSWNVMEGHLIYHLGLLRLYKS